MSQARLPSHFVRHSSAPVARELPRPHEVARPALAKGTGADRLVEALAAAGVDTYFGVPGGPIMPLFDAILRREKRLIESRHETHAAFAAAGYYRATGKVAAVVVTSGPGATNVVTGLVSAHIEGVPMLVISGDVAWASSGSRLLQSLGPENVGIEGMLANVTRATVRVALPRAAAPQAMAALRAATNPMNPGPALIVLPVDCGGPEVDSVHMETIRPSLSSHIETSVVEGVVEKLAAARHPVVIVGAGCRLEAESVERMIDALGIPFTTTPRAKGIISEDHPLSLRNSGMAASWWARRYMGAGVDVALVLGTDLDDVSVGPTPPIGPGGTLLHVDVNPAVFNRNYPTHTAITCDLGTFARRVCDVSVPGTARHARGAEARAKATQESAFDHRDFERDESPRLAPHRAVYDLQQAAGPGATFVTDIGEHMLFGLHYFTAKGPDDFVIHLGLGSMASGICSAIGLALGKPSRRVVCICGDGGMQMAGAELLVAQKLRLPIVYAVFNDGRYNMVYHGYKQQFGREEAWDTHHIDFVEWARSMGMPGVRIDHPGQITAELLDGLTASGLPVVLDIRHDPDVRIRGAGRIEALQQMSSAARPFTSVPAQSTDGPSQ